MNPTEFATKIRQKYPGAYDSLSDDELTQKVVTKYPVYASQVKMEPAKPKGTLLSPLKEGVDGLKTLYGGGEQGIANKLKQDIQAGAQDIQQGNVVKGVLKSGLRTAGDVAGAVYAPVGAALQATGINHVFDYLGQLSQKGGKYNPINLITDSKKLQDFVTARPNLEEDFGRALNIAFAKAEKGQIDPKTVVERTIKQIENVPNQVDAVTGKVVQKAKSIVTKTPDDIVNGRVNELKKISDNYASLRKNADFKPEEFDASVKRVADTDVLVDAIDDSGLIRTKQSGGAVEQYQKQTLDHGENVVRRNLEKLKETVTPDELKIRLEEAIDNSNLQGADLKVAKSRIPREIEGYKMKADANGNIPLTVIHDAKINTGKKVRDFATPAHIKAYEKALGTGLKEIVEKNSFFNVKEVNKALAPYLKDLEFLESLDGKKVKGGKLGKYFARATGNLVGGAIGSVGGPVGAAAGSIIGGELAGAIKGNALQKTLGGRTGKVPLKNETIQFAIAKADGNNVTNRINKNPQSTSNNKLILKNKTAPSTKTSDRIMSKTIPQKKNFIQRAVDKFKSIPNKQGGFVSLGGKVIKAIPEATKKEMVSTMNYLNQKGKFQYNAKSDRVLTDLMTKYKINPDWSNNKIADTIEKLIENTKTL